MNKDYIKANRRGSRDADLEDSTGFKAGDKPHRNKKKYSRKVKYRDIITSRDLDDIDQAMIDKWENNGKPQR